MLAGPLFTREWMTLPRRARFYLARSLYVGFLFVLLWTAWQALLGFDVAYTLGPIARFNTVAFELLSFTQLALVLFAGAVVGTGSISIEKDRRTFILLLVTRLTDGEIVVGKFAAALLQAGTILLASAPVFFLLPLFGGVSYVQVVEVLCATAGGTILATALGILMATWREKHFQALAMTILTIVLCLLAVEALVVLGGSRLVAGEELSFWAACLSPTRALAETMVFDPTRPHAVRPGACHLAVAILLSSGFLTTAYIGLRLWNPNRELSEPIPAARADQARRKHHRTVWDHPVWWREIATRAYGARPILLKLAFLVIAGVLLGGLFLNPPAPGDLNLATRLAQALIPVAILSLLLINAQSLAAITSERDLKSLDLLLVTDISASEFVWGKLGGVLYNVKEMIAAPLVFALVFALNRWIDWSGALEVAVAFLVSASFAAILGMHAGLRQETTRQAIAHSLGTMFLLMVGVLVCLYLIVISGRFEAQWASFVLFIVLGSIALWVSLSANAPSGAITLTAALLPVATFYAILAFVVGDRFAPFAVISGVYGFACAAMLIPLLAEFDVATGRTSAEGD